MNANELFFYLRGFFENITQPTEAQISAIRTEVLRTKPVEPQLIPVEVVNPTTRIAKTGDCNCAH